MGLWAKVVLAAMTGQQDSAEVTETQLELFKPAAHSLSLTFHSENYDPSLPAWNGLGPHVVRTRDSCAGTTVVRLLWAKDLRLPLGWVLIKRATQPCFILPKYFCWKSFAYVSCYPLPPNPKPVSKRWASQN